MIQPNMGYSGMFVLIGALLGAIVRGEESFEFNHPPNGYFGTVLETERNVTIDPPIRTQGKLICKFNIIHHHNTPKPPFQIDVEDQIKGIARVMTNRFLNCEEQNEYNMHIEAIACDGAYAERAILRIVVTDVNEFAPEFAEDSVSAAVQEGLLESHIIQVKAVDKDCSKGQSKICVYEIESKDQPFRISDEGIISNTVALNFTKTRNYVLSVVAYDCGGRKSTPILVIIEVKKPCQTGWTGLPSDISYIPGTGPQPLYSHSTLMFCPEPEAARMCPISSIEAHLALETRHVGKGCDRDTYSISNQRLLCGAHEEGINLLESVPHSMRDLSSESDQSISRFDGQSGLDMSEKMANVKLEKFFLSTWLKHEQSVVMEKHHKEHIICLADDHKKNRHHGALFVRNCKLVLLIRREYSSGEENIFRPAEWRWQLPQVCDNEWHHLAVNVNFPHVDLIVDGDLWTPEKDNPEIIDDWPLHPVEDEMTARMTVGACWQGSESRYRHELKGYLAGLTFLPGMNENLEVLKCLHQCSESLQVPASSSIAPGMEMVSNKLGTSVTVDGSDPAAISTLVNQVAYLNTREFPSPGKRILTLATKVHCQDGSTVALEDHKATIDVMSVPEPKLEIVGTNEIARDYDDFKLGVRIFTDVHIVMTTGSSPNGEPVNGIENRLDKCEVTVSPPLNSDHEFFEVPDDLLKSLKIHGSVSSSGAVFQGAEMIYNYERLLRQVTYTNQKPAYYLNRQFKIICSEMNNRFMSNEYEQTLTVIHPNPSKESESEVNSEAMDHDQIYEVPHAHRGLDEQSIDEVGFKETRNMFRGGQSGAHSNVVALIAVVCVAFLAVLLILGIIRVRASHQRGANEDLQAEVEMAWDDSPLNITVNPMQSAVASPADTPSIPTTLHENPCSDDQLLDNSMLDGVESDEDVDSYEEDEDDADEDDDLGSDHVRTAAGVMPRADKQRLEWDDQDL